ncbi:MAG TPA: MlaD family protein [Myxococcota bacterium]|nr:MlaD family protein [Myxococcota bacterium]HQK51895.1 MlaD family protein [Myxococcota bacterium]
MITAAQKVRLGVFVVTTTVIFAGTLIVLTGLRLSEQRDSYVIRYRMSLSGLEPSASVKLNGVRVGRVESIQIDREDPNVVVVEVSLEHGTPVKKDAKAVVTLTGITGLKYIEITGGSREAPFVEPGGEIPAGESVLDRLTGRAEDIAERIQLLVEQLNRFTDDEVRGKVLATVQHIDELAVSAGATIEENRPAIRDLAESLRDAGARVQAAVRVLETDLTAASRNVRLLSERLEKEVEPGRVKAIAGNLDRVVAQVRAAVDRANLPEVGSRVEDFSTTAVRLAQNLNVTVLRAREDLYAALQYLLETLENLSEFSRQIRENPGSLLGSGEEKERKIR